MIFNLENVHEKPVDLEYTLPKEWLKRDEYDDSILGLGSPISVRFHIKRIGERYVIEGRISGKIILRCDRCTEEFSYSLDSDFKIFLMPQPVNIKPDEEIELKEDDMSVVFISEKEIELDEIVRSEIYLALPMKFLCKEDCKGLCPVCGKNLNRERCNCQKMTGHPAFLKLKELKLKGDK